LYGQVFILNKILVKSLLSWYIICKYLSSNYLPKKNISPKKKLFISKYKKIGRWEDWAVHLVKTKN